MHKFSLRLTSHTIPILSFIPSLYYQFLNFKNFSFSNFRCAPARLLQVGRAHYHAARAGGVGQGHVGAIIADCATTSQWRFPYITTKLVVPQPSNLIQLLTNIGAFQYILYRSRYEAPRKPPAQIHNTSVKFSFPYTPLIAAKALRV